MKVTIYEKIKELIKIVCFSGKEKINLNERKNCFEIFGFDFIVDKNYEVFLLEVNTNPGLEESSELIRMLVPRMIDDAFRITIDEIFKTRYSKEFVSQYENTVEYISPFPVLNYSDQENLWYLFIKIFFFK